MTKKRKSQKTKELESFSPGFKKRITSYVGAKRVSDTVGSAFKAKYPSGKPKKPKKYYGGKYEPQRGMFEGVEEKDPKTGKWKKKHEMGEAGRKYYYNRDKMDKKITKQEAKAKKKVRPSGSFRIGLGAKWKQFMDYQKGSQSTFALSKNRRVGERLFLQGNK